jgi:hypothetical protein
MARGGRCSARGARGPRCGGLVREVAFVPVRKKIAVDSFACPPSVGWSCRARPRSSSSQPTPRFALQAHSRPPLPACASSAQWIQKGSCVAASARLPLALQAALRFSLSRCAAVLAPPPPPQLTHTQDKDTCAHARARAHTHTHSLTRSETFSRDPTDFRQCKGPERGTSRRAFH